MMKGFTDPSSVLLAEELSKRSPHLFESAGVSRTEAARASMAVLNEFFGREWHASVDGVAKETFPANLNQVAVALPPGEHVVEWRYLPRSYEFFGRIQAAAVLCFILACLFLSTRFLVGGPASGASGPQDAGRD
jgi:hypothetical protein